MDGPLTLDMLTLGFAIAALVAETVSALLVPAMASQRWTLPDGSE